MEINDELIVEMPCGKFPYKIKATKIVEADDKSIITLQNEKEEMIVNMLSVQIYG